MQQEINEAEIIRMLSDSVTCSRFHILYLNLVKCLHYMGYDTRSEYQNFMHA